MSSNNPSNFVYLVLNITRAAHFDIWRHVHLRIATLLEGQDLVSHYMVGISQPPLNLYFVWRLTQAHLTRLQGLSREIQIEILVEKQSGQELAEGWGTLGVQHAQVYKPNTTLYARHIPLETTGSSVGKGCQPELIATFTTTSTPPTERHIQLHIAYISEASQGRRTQSSGKSILKKSTNTTTKNNDKAGGSSQNPSNEDRQRAAAKTAKNAKSVTFQNVEE